MQSHVLEYLPSAADKRNPISDASGTFSTTVLETPFTVATETSTLADGWSNAEPIRCSLVSSLHDAINDANKMLTAQTAISTPYFFTIGSYLIST